MKEWRTPNFRNTPSTTNLEEEEIVDGLGNDGKASMPEQVKRPNPWRKMMMMIMMMINTFTYIIGNSFANFGLFFHKFYFIINTSCLSVRETLYPGRVKLFA